MTHEYPQFKSFKVLLLLPAISVLGGCESHPPIDKISAAEQSYNQANTSGGDRYAPLEMRIAQEKLNQAKAAMNDEKYERAAALAEEALVNAKLASAKADSAKATTQLEDLKNSINSLREELGTEVQQMPERR